MNKLALAVAILAIFALPAFAQRNGGHNGGHGGNYGGNHGGQQHQAQRGSERRGPEWRGEQHGQWHDRHGSGPTRRDGWRGGYRIDGYRWGRSFGYAHPFGWYGARWYGAPFMVGSRFWYSGFWFVLYQPVPVCWGPYATVYVDEIGGAYYVVNPACPGVSVEVGIVF